MTDELQEKVIWQNINSSKKKGKILEGKIIAIETEKMKDTNITCAIVDFKGVKILIPATEIIKNGKNDKKLLRNMMGADIKFIIVEADRTSCKAIGSRIMAMDKIRDMNFKKIELGDKIYAKIVGLWKKFIRIECIGMDFVVKAQDLQYGYIEDVSKIYKINEQIKVVIKEIDETNKGIKISIKDLLEDPFKNIRKDFTEDGEYLATITGYTENRNICQYSTRGRYCLHFANMDGYTTITRRQSYYKNI